MSTILTPLDASLTPAAMRRERQGQWLMVAGGLLLGTIGVFVEEAAQDPFTTVWFRCAFGALALLAWGATTGRLAELRLAGRDLRLALAAAALMILNWSLFFAAIPLTSIGLATVAFHVQPLWVMALGVWCLGESVSREQLGAALLALAGLTLATGLLEHTGPSRGMDWRLVLGLLMCLGGSLSYAAVTLIAKAAPRVSSFALAAWQCLAGLVLLSWWPLAHGLPEVGAAWAWLAGLGVLHTGLAYVVLYAGMARLSAGRIAVLQFVYPAAAVLMDWLVYGRALSPVQISGVAMMGIAIWVIRTRRG